MPTLKIDGETVTAVAGKSLLEAAREAGIALPALCSDARCDAIGSCRLCLVEIQGRGELVTACETPVEDGMWVATATTDLEEYRATMLGWYAERIAPEDFTAYPDKYLHRLMRRYGVAPAGKPADAERYDVSIPQIRVDMEQCVDCLRCVRICEEVQGDFVWHEIDRGDQSHIVPKRGILLAEGGCVACGACVDSCPTAALVDTDAGIAETWTRTTCAYCGVGCELEIGSAAGRIVASRPAMDAPVNKGHACAKGRYGFDFVHSPDRLTQPMISGPGGWRAASWDEALDACAARLQAIIADHGPDTIGILASSRSTNEDSYLAQKFARLVVGTHNVDCCARVCHTPTAAAMKAMLGAGAATNSFDDIEQAATILVAGANPLECHPVIGARIRQQVLRGKAKLIVVDPRRAGLAEIATIHLPLKPGTDIPLQNAIAHVILEEELHDRECARTRITGFAEFAAHVAEWTPERAAEICELPADDIRAAARLYATETPSYCAHGLGVTEHVQGTEGVMGLCNLALITGNIGKPGAGVNPLRGQNNVQGTAHMGCDPGILAGAQRLKDARGAFEAAWGQKLPAKPGLHLMEMIDAAEAGTLKGLVVIGYDIAATLANEYAVARALARLDTVIVVDLFMTETARRFGHILLPAASAFEKDGTFMNAERRIQRVRTIVEPPGAARTDWQILCSLAARMGHAADFDYDSPEAIWDEIRALWSAAAGIDYARLDRQGLQWPCPDEDHPGTAILHEKVFGHGKKAALRPLHFRPSPEQTDTDYPLLLTTGRALHQFNIGTMTGRTRQRQLRPTDRLDISPSDAREIGISNGDIVTVESRYGAAELPARIDTGLRDGRLFATFHDPARHVNAVTGPVRDRMVGAPEYKRTAVRVRRGDQTSTRSV
ncbi:formate dehydrogenase subunit alpha [Parasphingopyxis algicola]|uniref:formate dehydrogenase subunit alpha n=1 Tax=Parasphingopyxis algicola TaxID=2026624 RepID=UPI001C40973A|nr:formate dehydrogenase subunit alpha [Parasphingopyxis algicola]